jgi:tetratricopeptide (TPR) repeat protein
VGEDLAEVQNLLMQCEFESAEALARTGLATNPGNIRLTIELCRAITRQCDFSRALPIALGVANHDDASLVERIFATQQIAMCASQLGQPDLARRYIQRIEPAVANGPNYYQAIGTMLLNIGDAEAALALLSRGHAEYPWHANLRVSLGEARKVLGDSAGDEDYRHFSSPDYWQQIFQSAWTHKLWTDGMPLEGKRLLVVPHGGVGDYIHYARYIRALRDLGAYVAAALPNDLYRNLIASADPDELTSHPPAEFERCDYWLPVFGLDMPLSPVQRAATVPAAYLSVPSTERVDALVAAIRARAGGRKCIALNWQSDTVDGERKSIPTHAILPLFHMPDVHWVILQRGCGLRQLEATGLTRECSLAGVDLSFDEAGAVLTQIDGLLAIDSYASHLGGALGVRTWVLAGRALDQRYLNRERASVLYPASSTLARQPTIGDWGGAIAKAMTEISEMRPV